MKVALVNLASFEELVNIEQDILFLKENKIDYIDYFSGRHNFESLLDGFNQAVTNPEVDLIWFVCGGTKMIKFIEAIDWQVISETKKIYAGVSDFTHFAIKAASLGITCYYGLVLHNLTKYYPDSLSSQYIVDFLKQGQCATADSQVLLGDKKIESLPVVGGHLMSLIYMLSNVNLELKNHYLFVEYHHANGESLDELEYYFDQLQYLIKNNQPAGFILGHSIINDAHGDIIEVDLLNGYIVSWLKQLELPIYYVDHFSNIIKF